jgi:hypothetical protein
MTAPEIPYASGGCIRLVRVSHGLPSDILRNVGPRWKTRSTNGILGNPSRLLDDHNPH